MTKVIYKLPEGDLASRTQAIPQRHEIENFINQGAQIDLDLSGVFSISESYSDEIFGVLVVKLGVNKVLNQVRINNASHSTLKSIARVIQRRSNEVATKKANSFDANNVCATC